MRDPAGIVSKLCGGIAAVCLAAMMLVTVADVILRAVFNRPLRGTYELVELLLCATFFVALPAVFLRGDPIVVDSVDRCLPRAVPWLKRLAGVIAVVMLTLMAWQGAIAALEARAFGDVTADLSLPKTLYWIPLVTGVAGAAAAALVMTLRGRR